MSKVYLDYVSKKAKEMSAMELSWHLFKMTGQINYYLLFSAMKKMDKELTWDRNLESREL